MAKKKQKKSKKLTIKIPQNQNNATVNELDDLDKPLEFPDSPIPAVDNSEKMGQLYKAVWSVNNEEDQLIDDKEIEIDEQEVDIESNTNSTSPGISRNNFRPIHH